jgi:hypothetical protein
MNPPFKFRTSSQIALAIIFVVFAFIILYISLVRASFGLMTKDNNEDKLRKNPIEYTIINKDGQSTCTYKLPEVGTLPGNPLYGIKKIRDFMWVNLSKNPAQKAEVLLLLADKTMAEAIRLSQSQKFELALDTSEEAINKLKYADKAISEINRKNIQVRELEQQIIKAGCAYRKALLIINQDNKLNEEKYKKVTGELEKWNQEKEKAGQGI